MVVANLHYIRECFVTNIFYVISRVEMPDDHIDNMRGSEKWVLYLICVLGYNPQFTPAKNVLIPVHLVQVQPIKSDFACLINKN